jgi:pimeloyl-ACP methyl ester carboxylesterase
MHVSFYIALFMILGDWSMAEAKGRPRVVTVFYPGMFSTQAQAAKLVGPRGFHYPYTNELVRASRSINAIINLQVYPEIDEVELWNLEHSPLWYGLRPITLSWFLARHLNHRYNGILVEQLEGHPGTGSSLWTHAIRLRLMGLGQERDIAEHYKRVALCRNENPDADIVLYGVSRGASTTFIAEARHRYKHVKALVLEGCPDAISNVVKEAHGSVVHYLYRKAIRFITEHDPEGISALAVVDQFPHDIPVLFITSEKDTVVPASCTLRLAHALANVGHPHIYCLVLKNASHEGYAFEDYHDARSYQAVVHAFYKKQSIAGYREDFAAEGAELLRKCHITKI